jgi:hypothetical protein
MDVEGAAAVEGGENLVRGVGLMDGGIHCWCDAVSRT